jgi:hypothetical protein
MPGCPPTSYGSTCSVTCGSSADSDHRPAVWPGPRDAGLARGQRLVDHRHGGREGHPGLSDKDLGAERAWRVPRYVLSPS